LKVLPSALGEEEPLLTRIVFRKGLHLSRPGHARITHDYLGAPKGKKKQKPHITSDAAEDESSITLWRVAAPSYGEKEGILLAEERPRGGSSVFPTRKKGLRRATKIFVCWGALQMRKRNGRVIWGPSIYHQKKKKTEGRSYGYLS